MKADRAGAILGLALGILLIARDQAPPGKEGSPARVSFLFGSGSACWLSPCSYGSVRRDEAAGWIFSPAGRNPPRRLGVCWR